MEGSASRRIEWRVLSALAAGLSIAGVILWATTAARAYDIAWVMTRFLFGTVAIGGALLLAGRYVEWRGHRPAAFDPQRLARVLAVAAIVAVTIPVFGIFKQFVLPLRGFPYDPHIAAFGRALFLGHDPWLVAHQLIPWLWATIAFDRLYSLWMILMMVFPVAVAGFVPSGQVRARLVACWVLAWAVIGGLGAWLLASAGPCYYTALVELNERFAQLDAILEMKRTSAAALGTSIGALDFQQLLLQAHGSGIFAPAGGISAMPSMHVAMATLFAIGGFRVARWLGWLMTAYCALIWIGSVHLGWHYVADGLVSIPAILLLWRATGFGWRWLERRAAVGADAPGVPALT